MFVCLFESLNPYLNYNIKFRETSFFAGPKRGLGADGRGWARMGADGRGWARMGADGRGWARMGADGRGWARVGTGGRG